MSAERYLAIETSSSRLSLAAGSDHKVLARFQGPMRWRHAESLFSSLERLLRRVRWSVQSLDGVAVCTGPGSFTGIRVGMAAARTLGQALGIPVVGVSSLEALAFGQKEDGLISPVVDAQQGWVFAALFERTRSGGWRRLIAETRTPAEEWGKTLATAAKGRTIWVSKDRYPRASDVLQLAAPRLKKAGPTSYRRVLPLYLRQAAAEERRRG